MISDDIEKHILLIANYLSKNVIEKEIINAYSQNGFAQDEIYLLLTAGKILYLDRINAKPKKSSFRRVI